MLKTETKLHKAIREAIESMNDAAVIELHNAYCEETNHYDDHIFPMHEFDEQCEGMSPICIAMSIHFGDFNPNDDYFRYDGQANFASFNYWTDDNAGIYIDEIADYIEEKGDALWAPEIASVIEEYEAEQEEEEAD